MRAVLTISLLMGLIYAAATPALAQAETTTTNQSIPINTFVGNPCVAETVDITGSMKVVTHTTVSANGNFHFVGELNFQGVSGTGRTSGSTYRATNAGTSTFNGGGNFDSTREFTVEFTFQLVSAGSGDNFRAQGLVHITVTPNGETSSEVIRFDSDCSG
jgi:hypothetical protein